MALVAVLLWFAVVAGAASTLYFPDYVVGSGWSVQLALGNVDTTDAAEVIVEVYDQDGVPTRDLFDSASAFEIPPLGSRVLRNTEREAFGAAGSRFATLRPRSGDC